MSTIAVLIPAIITGMAIGNSTLVNRRMGFIPIPFAASTSDGSTSFTPVYVLRNIGKSAYTTSAMIAGNRPIPNNGIINPSNANEGIVCSIAAIFMTISDIFFVLVNKIPSGTAMIVAINKAINDICICSIIVESNCPLRSASVCQNSCMGVIPLYA
ncbi:Uncharacterised protein [Streptococcus pneumoniae]|nr:Uncharacterised protein [Streptococcus pneumoniae]